MWKRARFTLQRAPGKRLKPRKTTGFTAQRLLDETRRLDIVSRRLVAYSFALSPWYASVIVTKSFLQRTSAGNPEGVRRMVAGWQAVERQEREERRQAGPDTAMAIRGALELMDLFGAMHGWPPPENEARRRDDELARSRWVRVRSFYQAHGQAAQQENP